MLLCLTCILLYPQGSQCFCVGPANEPLEGYTTPVSRSAGMHCRCAREEWQLRKQRLPGRSVRCDQLGNYHPQQCTGSSCYQVCAERRPEAGVGRGKFSHGMMITAVLA